MDYYTKPILTALRLWRFVTQVIHGAARHLTSHSEMAIPAWPTVVAHQIGRVKVTGSPSRSLDGALNGPRATTYVA
jgi:hypothetical protein